ncbi:MAG: hypothetical protein JJ953_09055 [Gracilimonas sp.]|uniref:hypothetical protein n=1 Tax=Gracilimonas sp. TaxID=1974203 RepID=UPI001B0E5879|nr:hypothetical protein [Gracilimonas sp.]MBO6586237.1 hypothetical protein [Gracilimonas sp.]MBO6614894.1 hypothetical protein [Gracilimonas sp.]
MSLLGILGIIASIASIIGVIPYVIKFFKWLSEKNDKRRGFFQNSLENNILLAIYILEAKTDKKIAEKVNVLTRHVYEESYEDQEILKELPKLMKKKLIKTHNNDSEYRLTDPKGIKRATKIIARNWDSIRSAAKNKRSHEILDRVELMKFILEKAPEEIRSNRLSDIISYLQKKYQTVIWKTEVNHRSTGVPFQIIRETGNQDLTTELIKGHINKNELEIDENVITYYQEQEKDPKKNIHDGTVFRVYDYSENLELPLKLLTSDDCGYFEFQATCGVIRNEIEHKIVIKDDDAFNLPYRQNVMHSNTRRHDVIKKYLKKRVLKTGIETSTILVKKNDSGMFANPRIPIIFRNNSVAEYPNFTMTIPSGAYQPGIDKKNKENIPEQEIAKRVDWKFSLIRELGEELFNLDKLDEANIKDIKTPAFKITEQICNESILCKAQAFGIDLYIGSGGILVTLVLDQDKVTKTLRNYQKHDEYHATAKHMLDFFETLLKGGNVSWKEGQVKLFNFDKNYLNAISIPYNLNKETEPIRIPDISGNRPTIEPMIPSGVISSFYAMDALKKIDNIHPDVIKNIF